MGICEHKTKHSRITYNGSLVMRISDRMFYIEWGYDGICIINMAVVFVQIGGDGGYFQVATKNGREIMITLW